MDSYLSVDVLELTPLFLPPTRDYPSQTWFEHLSILQRCQQELILLDLRYELLFIFDHFAQPDLEDATFPLDELCTMCHHSFPEI
jgi:hypothetical protein